MGGRRQGAGGRALSIMVLIEVEYRRRSSAPHSSAAPSRGQRSARTEHVERMMSRNDSTFSSHAHALLALHQSGFAARCWAGPRAGTARGYLQTRGYSEPTPTFHHSARLFSPLARHSSPPSVVQSFWRQLRLPESRSKNPERPLSRGRCWRYYEDNEVELCLSFNQPPTALQMPMTALLCPAWADRE